jgi:thymidylate synthase
MRPYLDLLEKVLKEGTERKDRTGVGTVGIFGVSAEYDLVGSFPLLTTKKMFWKGIVEELLWILRGETNINTLKSKGVHIWDEWADENGDLGPLYGHQMRNWNSEGIDQLQSVIHSLKHDPFSRRHIISLWNPGQLDEMKLPPCHGIVIQFYVTGKLLSCSMYQRSADLFLGVPFNIASYSLLTLILAKMCGYLPDKFVHFIGDCHIYKNHIEQVKLQVSRSPYQPPPYVSLPQLDNITDYNSENIKLFGYRHHPPIKGDVAV